MHREGEGVAGGGGVLLKGFEVQRRQAKGGGETQEQALHAVSRRRLRNARHSPAAVMLPHSMHPFMHIIVIYNRMNAMFLCSADVVG